MNGSMILVNDVQADAMQQSTKEIAREAVEAEFQRAGKRRKRNVDSSDDEEDKKKKGRHQKNDTFREPKRPSSSELERLSAKYRDRVKERREGINAEDGDVATLKFSVEDQLFNDVVNALESGNRQKLTRMARPDDGIRIPTTFEEALDYISDSKSKLPQTQLGTDVLSHLQKAYLSVNSDSIRLSVAGQNVQQSVWTFTKAINADPRDRDRSWEVPLEQTFAVTNSYGHPDSDEYVVNKASVATSQCLSQMLDLYTKRAKQQERRGTSDELSTFKAEGNADEEDDDDIFANVGEYDVNVVPENISAEKSRSEKHTSKRLIFGIRDDKRKIEDRSNPEYTPMEVESPVLVHPALRKLSSLGLMERDVDVELDFGGQDYDDDDDDDGKIGKRGKSKKDDITSKHKMKSKKNNKGIQRPI